MKGPRGRETCSVNNNEKNAGDAVDTDDADRTVVQRSGNAFCTPERIKNVSASSRTKENDASHQSMIYHSRRQEINKDIK
jgi:hypothetical protein